MKLRALGSILLPPEKKGEARIKIKAGEIFECSDAIGEDLISMNSATKKISRGKEEKEEPKGKVKGKEK